jgi:DNA end-binding protein Ku
VIEALSEDWDPEKYHDRYRDRLRTVVQRKGKGETITAPDADEAPEPAPDLMAALERTLEELQQRGSR